MTGSYQFPEQSGRNVVVTGANSGIGFEVARRLAGAGARVTLAVRSTDRGQSARAKIIAAHPAMTVAVVELDLADLASVGAFADRWLASARPLDLLIHCAGVMAVPERRLSKDRHELQFATNYLGPFALTGRLLPALRVGPESRVVTVSSLAARMGPIDLGNLQGERSYSAWGAYGQSKLADLIFAREFARRSSAGGWAVAGVAAHPGLTRSSLYTSGPGLGGSRLGRLGPAFIARVPGLLQPVERGAEPILFAATSPDIVDGGYYGPAGPLEIHGGPAPARVPSGARDTVVADRLWEISEDLTGVRFP